MGIRHDRAICPYCNRDWSVNFDGSIKRHRAGTKWVCTGSGLHINMISAIRVLQNIDLSTMWDEE